MLPSDRWRHPFLLFANFFFYGWWDWRFTALLAAVILISYVAGRLIERAEGGSSCRKYFLMAACTLLLGILGYFKYTNFFLGSLRGLIEQAGGRVAWNTLKIILPAGISFYIFQAISYIVTVYRGKLIAEQSIVKLGVYLSFFPHLVAGPIIHAPTFLPQLTAKRIFEAPFFVEGARKFALGFLYKAVFADHLAAVVNPIFATLSKQTPLTLFGGCLGFYGQIYFDFAGYSLMAIGVANLLGYTLPDNFNFPYRATSLVDFWHRWHISLSTWLRDYLYIPLGGNRCSLSRNYFNIIVTMLLGGLWHGASWNYLLWGGIHGVALCLNHLWRRIDLLYNSTADVHCGVAPMLASSSMNYTLSRCASEAPGTASPAASSPRGLIKLPTVLSWFLTQAVVFFCWIPFRAATLQDTIFIFQQFWKGITQLCDMTLFSSSPAAIAFPWLLVVLPLFFDMALNGSQRLRECCSIHSTMLFYGMIAIALFVGLLFMPSGTVNFIYFQF